MFILWIIVPCNLNLIINRYVLRVVAKLWLQQCWLGNINMAWDMAIQLVFGFPPLVQILSLFITSGSKNWRWRWSKCQTGDFKSKSANQLMTSQCLPLHFFIRTTINTILKDLVAFGFTIQYFFGIYPTLSRQWKELWWSAVHTLVIYIAGISFGLGPEVMSSWPCSLFVTY